MISYGIDFGTSNSAIAINKSGSCSLFKHQGSSSGTIRSIIYYPEQEGALPSIGEDGIAKYFESKMKGRLLQSIKSVLPDPSFLQTTINNQSLTIEYLVSLILKYLKKQADAYVNCDVKKVVLGRPVRFSNDEKEDEVAQNRLRNAASMAGFEEISFQLEPIAAALYYENCIIKPQTVFIADLGAGTADFAILRLDPALIDKVDRKTDILASGGVHIGGDDLDTSIMWNKVCQHFGYGANYSSWGKTLPVPVSILYNVCKWERLSYLKNDRFIYNSIKSFHKTTDQPQSLLNLLSLIDNNLGYSIFREIERSKIKLSSDPFAQITYSNLGIILSEKITILEFNNMIKNEINQMKTCALNVLQSAGLKKEQIDLVYLTGGCSLVKSIRGIFHEIFGIDKCKVNNTFTSVAEGLALSVR